MNAQGTVTRPETRTLDVCEYLCGRKPVDVTLRRQQSAAENGACLRIDVCRGSTGAFRSG